MFWLINMKNILILCSHLVARVNMTLQLLVQKHMVTQFGGVIMKCKQVYHMICKIFSPGIMSLCVYGFKIRLIIMPFLVTCSCIFCHLLMTFTNSLDPDQTDRMLVLIWIQTVWYSDNVPERICLKRSADDNSNYLVQHLCIKQLILIP